jgi:hypothetical protein
MWNAIKRFMRQVTFSQVYGMHHLDVATMTHTTLYKTWFPFWTGGHIQQQLFTIPEKGYYVVNIWYYPDQRSVSYVLSHRHIANAFGTATFPLLWAYTQLGLVMMIVCYMTLREKFSNSSFIFAIYIDGVDVSDTLLKEYATSIALHENMTPRAVLSLYYMLLKKTPPANDADLPDIYFMDYELRESRFGLDEYIR